MTAAYLINRLPSSIIQWQTPHYRLFGQQTDYSSLRTFGCLCFASTLTLERSKFHPRATPAVFISYPLGMKGYKLLNIQTQRVFVSRDIIFYEHVFLFHTIAYTNEIIDPFPDLVFSRNVAASQPNTSHGARDQTTNILNHQDDIPMNNEPNIIGETDTTSADINIESVEGVENTDANTNTLPLGNLVTRKSSRVSKPSSYLQDFHCGLLLNNFNPPTANSHFKTTFHMRNSPKITNTLP